MSIAVHYTYTCSLECYEYHITRRYKKRLSLFTDFGKLTCYSEKKTLKGSLKNVAFGYFAPYIESRRLTVMYTAYTYSKLKSREQFIVVL